MTQRRSGSSIVRCRVLSLLTAALLASSCRSGDDGDPWETGKSVQGGAEPDDGDPANSGDDGDSESPSAGPNTSSPNTHTPDASDLPPNGHSGGNVEAGGALTAPVGSSSPPQPECEPTAETCDELDNDCDGEVDEGYICPADGTLVDPTPFDGGVYFRGTTAEGSAGSTALQRFWPSLHDSYVNGFGYYDTDFVLRRSDWQLFYLDTSKLFGRVEGALPITGCSATMMTHYDFDAADTLHYQCPAGLFRSEGELVSDDAGRLLGVMDDGRMAISRDQRFGYIDVEGAVQFSDLFVAGQLVFESSTSAGNSVFAVYHREVPEPEQIIFRFDQDSKWTVMRRIPTDLKSSGAVALPDGTLFLENADRIIGFMPDGSEVLVWEETDEKVVRMHGGSQLLLGPRDPSLIVQ